MARVEDLGLYKDTKELCLKLLTRRWKIDRTIRYTLWEDACKYAVKLLHCVVKASHERDNKRLEAVNEYIECFEYLSTDIQLLIDVHVIGKKDIDWVFDLMDKMDEQAWRWKKYLERNEESSSDKEKDIPT